VMGMYIYGASRRQWHARRQLPAAWRASAPAVARQLLTHGVRDPVSGCRLFACCCAGGGVGVRAAPVDTRTGEFLAGGLSTTLASAAPEARAAPPRSAVCTTVAARSARRSRAHATAGAQRGSGEAGEPVRVDGQHRNRHAWPRAGAPSAPPPRAQPAPRLQVALALARRL
jgi:hypothetical protein